MGDYDDTATLLKRGGNLPLKKLSVFGVKGRDVRGMQIANLPRGLLDVTIRIVNHLSEHPLMLALGDVAPQHTPDNFINPPLVRDGNASIV